MHSKLPNQGLSIFAVMSGLANRHGAINLSQGFPDFESDPRLIELVHQKMRQGHNQYAPMPGVLALRQVIAAKIHGLYGTTINPDNEITITAGATQALFNIFTALVHPGDEVIVFEPAYDSYVPAIRLAGGIPVPISIKGPDFEVPWDEVRQRISGRTRLMIITNPHNPLGTCLEGQDLEVLNQLVHDHDLTLISDEVYEHLIYDHKPHLSVLKYPVLYQRSLAVYSFGKTFHNTGWKIGYIVAPPALTEEVRKIHQFNVFSVNTPIQMALADYMEDASTYHGLSAFFQEKRDLLSSLLEQGPLKPITCQGSYFLLADYSELSDLDDLAFAEWLTVEHGVATIPLSPFYTTPPGDKVVRFCFAKENETLQSAGQKLMAIS